MKGIILAGGSGTRLHPLTHVVSKQLMAIYDKPMLYYPLSTLMLAGIRDVLIISTPQSLPDFEELLGDGGSLGMSFQYAVQANPEGLPQAFVIGKRFLQNGPACLILGDNIFHGAGLTAHLQSAAQLKSGGLVFGYWVKDPERYGVVNFADDDSILGFEEKPIRPQSHWALPGMYFFDAQVCDIAAELRPSRRGETEIIDVARAYHRQGKLKVMRMPRGMAWLDTGTHESLLQAGNYIQTIEERQGLKIGCIEEIAYRMRFIDKAQLQALGQKYSKNQYGEYLLRLVREEKEK
jgi:glucose-1-phosphate thymidylyltransferase